MRDEIGLISQMTNISRSYCFFFLNDRWTDTSTITNKTDAHLSYFKVNFYQPCHSFLSVRGFLYSFLQGTSHMPRSPRVPQFHILKSASPSRHLFLHFLLLGDLYGHLVTKPKGRRHSCPRPTPAPSPGFHMVSISKPWTVVASFLSPCLPFWPAPLSPGLL